MATIGDLVIGLIRQSSYPKIAVTIWKIKHDPHLLLCVMSLLAPTTMGFAL